MPYSRYIFPLMMDLALRGSPFPQYRDALLQGVSGSVLELGAGTGLNFRHYPPTVGSLTVIDPNPGMNSWIKRRQKKVPFPVIHHQTKAESLPFDDHTFDFVICTFTLCSIPDLDQALHEVKRVMRPGAEFRYVEHGLSKGTWHERWQHALTPLQRRIGDGCHLNRAMHELVENAGFTLLHREEGFAPHTPGLFGYLYVGKASVTQSGGESP